MSLSDDERDRLLEIETLTAAQDPGFVARLDLDATVRRRLLLRPLCWCLLALGGLLVARVGRRPFHQRLGSVVVGGGQQQRRLQSSTPTIVARLLFRYTTPTYVTTGGGRVRDDGQTVRVVIAWAQPAWRVRQADGATPARA